MILPESPILSVALGIVSHKKKEGVGNVGKEEGTALDEGPWIKEPILFLVPFQLQEWSCCPFTIRITPAPSNFPIFNPPTAQPVLSECPSIGMLVAHL